MKLHARTIHFRWIVKEREKSRILTGHACWLEYLEGQIESFTIKGLNVCVPPKFISWNSDSGVMWYLMVGCWEVIRFR